MIIKGHDGESHNVTSQGQGTYNTIGASAGIASFLGLNAGNMFGGWGGYGYTTTYLMGKINDVASEVRANKDAQCEINREQAVYNGVNTATLNCIKGQIAELQSLSELIVPARKVCNTCCNCE